MQNIINKSEIIILIFVIILSIWLAGGVKLSLQSNNTSVTSTGTQP